MEVTKLPTDFKPGCTRPKSTLIVETKTDSTSAENRPKEETRMIKVGAPAPDFELAAYHQGSFKNYRLSEFKGKWVVLCFYPGDFTFV